MAEAEAPLAAAGPSLAPVETGVEAKATLHHDAAGPLPALPPAVAADPPSEEAADPAVRVADTLAAAVEAAAAAALAA